VSIVPASGGPSRELTRLADQAAGRGKLRHKAGAAPLRWIVAAWSPDGNFLFTSNRAKAEAALAIIRISVATGERRTITAPRPTSESDVAPAVSPDGRWLAFVRVSGEWNGDLYLLSLSDAPLSMQPVRLTKDSAYAGTPAWMPSGSELVFSSNRAGRRELWSIKPRNPGGPAIDRFGEGALDTAISRNGRLAYTRTIRSSSLWRIRLKPDAVVTPKLDPHNGVRLCPGFLADSKRIVFTSTRSGANEIWTAEANGSNSNPADQIRRWRLW